MENKIVKFAKGAVQFVQRNPKVFLFGGMLMFATAGVFAQGAAAGAAAIKTAAESIKTYEDSVKSLMKAIALVIAIVGAFVIYFKMQNGDQDVKKTIMLVLGGCIAFVVLSEALPKFFN